MVRQAGLPRRIVNQPLLLDGVDVSRQAQSDHVGLLSIDNGTGLLPRSSMGAMDDDILLGFLLPVVGEGRVDGLVQLASRVIGDVQQREFILMRSASA